MSVSCKEHPEQPALARCVGCGKLLCDACRHKIDNRNYCNACQPPARRGKRALLAALLSIVPGLGQLYCGYPFRALVYLATMAWMGSQLRGLAPSGPESALPIAALWFLSICDAFALARRSKRGLTTTATGPTNADTVNAHAVSGNAGNPKPQSLSLRAPKKSPKKSRSHAPDIVFLGLTATGLGAVLVLQHTTAPWLSVTIMWPIALVLFGLTVAFSRS
ncbi:MAG: hypothetical protein AB1486_07525 [Planctomycetota bacterium]